MDSTAPDELRVKWRATFVVLVVAIVAVFTLLLWSTDLGFFASLFLVVPLTSLVLIGFLVRARGRTLFVRLALLCLYALLSWQMLKHSDAMRSEARWLVGSQHWKAEVLKEPTEPGSELKTVIWDGWGMFAQDTDVYLVFSPDDGLRNYSPSSLNGLPCPVWHVQRLEKHWYSVTFYTNEGWWPDCGVSQP